MPAVDPTFYTDDQSIKFISHLSDPSADRQKALTSLTERLETLAVANHRAQLIKMGRDLRDGGGCESLVGLISSPDPELHNPALLLVSNVASDNIDPAATVSRERMRASGVLQALLPHLSASNHNTMLFALGVLMNFISDHREPMLNAASPLRKQYKPILEGLGESANEQLRLFSQMALAQLKRGVETREEFYATKIEALFRGRKARSELGARRWRVVTDRIANELAWEVVEELAQPTITWGVGYASVVVSATINVQAGARRQLAKIHAIEARHHRLKVHDVCEDVCDELFDRIISSFVKPMCGTLLAESRLEFALPAAAAEAAMRAAAEAEENEAKAKEARERQSHASLAKKAEERKAEEAEARKQAAIENRLAEIELAKQRKQRLQIKNDHEATDDFEIVVHKARLQNLEQQRQQQTPTGAGATTEEAATFAAMTNVRGGRRGGEDLSSSLKDRESRRAADEAIISEVGLSVNAKERSLKSLRGTRSSAMLSSSSPRRAAPAPASPKAKVSKSQSSPMLPELSPATAGATKSGLTKTRRPSLGQTGGSMSATAPRELFLARIDNTAPGENKVQVLQTIVMPLGEEGNGVFIKDGKNMVVSADRLEELAGYGKFDPSPMQEK